MGRGRQKAKATRQAREMKYYSPGTDLHALERELGSPGSEVIATEWVDTPKDDDSYDQYGDDDVDNDAGEYRRG